ncbi:MAG: T9SS type A sorting domain-containing protein [bacterium]
MADGSVLTADPINDSVYWTGGKYGYMSVCKTTDNGIFWERQNISEPLEGWAYDLAIDPTDPDIVYAGGIPDLYKTVDGGRTWVVSSMGIDGYVNDLEIDPQDTDIIFAGTASGIYKTTDAAMTWQYAGLSDVNALLMNPLATDTIYAGTGAGVFNSRDQGSTWHAMGLEDEHITEMKIDPDDYLFAGTEGAGMFRWNINVSVTEKPGDAQIQQLMYAAPNPAKSRTTIHYQLINTSAVSLTIYDIQGRFVKKLVNNQQTPGVYAVPWDGIDTNNKLVSAGVYFYMLSVDGKTAIQKIILLK